MTTPGSIAELAASLATAAASYQPADLPTVLPIMDLFEDLQVLAEDQASIKALAIAALAHLNGLFDGSTTAVDGEAAQIQIIADQLALDEMDEGFAWPPGMAGAKPPTSPRLLLDVPDFVDDSILTEFIDRLGSGATEAEEHILQLEDQWGEPHRTEAKGIIHTIKGESGALGLAILERVAHLLEDLLEGDVAPTDGVDRLLAGVDWIRQVASTITEGRTALPAMPSVLSLQPQASDDDDSLLPSDEVQPDEIQSSGLEFNRDPAELMEFLGEVREHLDAADELLLEVESCEPDPEHLGGLFRAFHTIKGLAGFFNANQIARIAHETENLMDEAREGRLDFVGGAVDVVFDAVSALRNRAKDLQTYVETGDLPDASFNLTDFERRIHAAMRGQSSKPSTRLAPLEIETLTSTLIDGGIADAGAVTATVVKKAKDGVVSPTELAKELVKDGHVTAKQAAKAMRASRSGDTAMLAQEASAPEPAPEPAPAVARSAAEVAPVEGNRNVQIRESVKVDAQRLDKLVDLIGELVIAQSMVSQSAAVQALDDATIMDRLDLMDKLTRELQDIGTGLRMVPVKGTFQRMARLVRDLSRKLDKPLEFTMQGEDTELDKTVVDAIGDPLVHMIRNAVDHGLESSVADREAAGKDTKGHIILRAYHQGGSIYIEIKDDGRGLDRDRILKKAVDRGLVDDPEALSDREVWMLIFHAGFSTAQQLSDVSGRGVGMDVVKRTIEGLRGQVDISSEPGVGTTFTIRLPLTLAVIDGMVLQVGSERYILPTLTIISSLRPTPEQLATCISRGEMLRWQGNLLPVHRLHELFDIADATTDPCLGLCVVVEDEGRQFAILVDDLLGQQQVVIKPLGKAMRQIPGLSGGAIMPDGTIGLILDVVGLSRLTQAGDEPRLISGGTPA